MSMGTLGTLDAIVPEVSKSISAYRIGSFFNFFKCVTIPTNIFFVFEICTSTYVEILGLVSRKCPRFFSYFKEHSREQKPKKT